MACFEDKSEGISSQFYPNGDSYDFQPAQAGFLGFGGKEGRGDWEKEGKPATIPLNVPMILAGK